MLRIPVLFLLALAGTLLFISGVQAQAPPSAAGKPNILILYGDDIGITKGACFSSGNSS